MAPKKRQVNEESKVMAEDAGKIKKPAKKTAALKKDEKSAPEKTEKKSEMARPAGVSPDRGALILGGGLLIMGVLLLLGRLLQIPFGDYLWPFIFIVPGVLVFLTALSTNSSSGEGLSILGAILTMLGLVFLAQKVTGLWATWAYVWALIAPTSVGIAQMVYGMNKDRDQIVQSGRRLATLGLIMFAIGFVFFELIIGLSGFGLAALGLPVFPMVLIFVGIVVLARSIFRGR